MTMVYYPDAVVLTVRVGQDKLEAEWHDVGLGKMQGVDFW